MNDLQHRRVFEDAISAVLAVTTLLAVPGMRGILTPGSGLGRLVVAAFVIHTTMWACRRSQLPGELIIGFGLVALVVIVFGGGEGGGGHDIGLALEAIDTSPVDSAIPESDAVIRGRLLIALIVVGLCSLLADQGAFRVRGSFLALTPSFSLILVGAVRGNSQHRAAGFVGYLVASLVFLMLHHAYVADHAAVGPAAARGHRRHGPAMSLPAVLANLAPGAAMLLVAAVVAAVVVAPRLPGYGEKAVVGPSGTGGRQTGSGNGTISISPIVDIRPSLVDRPATELFTVRSDAPASYWRLTSLDEFDGRLWKAGARTEGFPNDVPFSTRTEVVFQDFRMGPLSSEWLPAAYRAQSATGIARLADNDSYALRAEGGSSVNARYRVTSLVITPSTDRLLNSPPVSGPSSAATRYLSLPGSLTKRVVEEAQRVTAEAAGSGPYAAARALQDHFRENFTYDQKVAAGNSTKALERFLFNTKRGYCEQFAGAYAVMARSLGLPARVAVGFTSGELQNDGLYHVQAVNAHAWPEVYLQGAGWVAFEPTPGRGMPGAQEYTGVAPAQARPIRSSSTDPTTVTTGPQGGPLPTTPGPPAPDDPPVTVENPEPTVPTVPKDTVPTTAPTVTAPVTSTAERGSSLAFFAVLGVVAAVAVPLLGMRIIERRRRRARLRAVSGTNAEVLDAWWDAAHALAQSGLGRRSHETMLDHARRTAGDERLPASVTEPMLVLAGRAGTAAYSTADLDAETVAECRRAAATVTTALHQARPVARRALGKLVVGPGHRAPD